MNVYTQAWFSLQSIIYLPTVCEKVGQNDVLFNVSTNQCSILFNNLGFFNRKSEFWKPENLNEAIAKGENFNIAELSFVTQQKVVETILLMLTGRQKRTICRPTQGSRLKTMAWWDAIQPEAMTCQSMQELMPQGYVRLLWESNGEANKFTHVAIFEVKLVRIQKEHSQICASKQLIRLSLTLELLH